ncbi:hypothetical protein [Thermocoleostomius sinensis]|uniref:Uncharacterized protein n=1 Tax=Thermocoleostomius sinensis A174 TaxID=2016057 RepID=A0A9E8ZET2_9CYAN|nr:hypothetical protein [Thermocoleostomius sinensis]WAL62049.1 hypothetical protein OXH18_08715 [Thermocoleostomius sinensis A174]
MVKHSTAVVTICIGILSSASIALVLTWLYQTGCISQEFPYLGAKALLAYSGPEPRFESFGYVFPPLIIYGVLLTGTSPIAFQALVGGSLVGLIMQQMGRVSVSRLWQVLWTLLIFIHPSFGLMALYRPDWATATLLLMGAMTLLLDLAQERDKRLLSTGLALVLLGFVLAPLMLVRFEAWYLLPILAVTILVTFYNTEPPGFQISAALVVLFMSLVAVGAFLYFNWITTDDAFYFVNSSNGSLQQARNLAFVQQEKIDSSVIAALKWLITTVPVYLVTILGVIFSANKHRAGLILILLLPVFMLIISFWKGLFFPSASQLGLFLGLLPVIWWHAPPRRLLSRILITVTLVASLLYTGYRLQQNEFVPEETLLWRQLSGQPIPETPAVQQSLAFCQAERDIADLLDNTLTGPSRLLVDDTVGSGILYRVRRPDAFILPYQFEFVPALQNPGIYTDFILLAGPSSPVADRDRVGAFWSQRSPETLPGFQVIRENPFFQLLQRGL